MISHDTSSLLIYERSYQIINYTKNIQRLSEKQRSAVYSGADKSLARPGRKQATATEDFDFHISYL